MTPPQLTNGEDPMTTGPDWDHSGLAQEVELDEAMIRELHSIAVSLKRIADFLDDAKRDHESRLKP